MLSCLGAAGADTVASDNITILVGTTKGAFLISGGSDRSGWKVTGPHCDGWPINHLVGDGGDRDDLGRRRRRLARRGRLALGGRRRELAGHPAHQGRDGRLGGQRPGLRPHDRLDRRGAALRRRLRADLVAVPRPRPALRRNQAREPAAEPRRRPDLGADRGPDRAPLGRKLEPRRRGPRPAHDPLRPGRTPTSSGSASRPRASSPPRTAARPGSAATASRTPRPATGTTTRPRRATARPGIACTT